MRPENEACTRGSDTVVNRDKELFAMLFDREIIKVLCNLGIDNNI